MADMKRASILYPLLNEQYLQVKLGMSDDIRFYKGKHKVRVLTESKGNWIVEALEPFEDVVNGEKVSVKTGERRFMAPNLLLKKRSLPPTVKEHTYELKMEKKLKHFIEEQEKKDTDKTA